MHEEDLHPSGIWRNLMNNTMEQQEGTSNQDMGMRPWANLPDDILELISERLILLDYVRFHIVCKGWRKVKPPLFFPQLVMQTMKGSKDELSSVITSRKRKRKRDKCPYFIIDIQERTLCNFTVPDFEGRTFMGSYHGWLVMGRRGIPFECFLLNLFTNAHIQLPPLDHTITDPTVYLSSAPTSPECVVLVIDSSVSSFLFCKPGDVEWAEGECDYPFHSKFGGYSERDYLESITTLGEKFYALSYRGKLVTIDDVIHPRTITVLPVHRVRSPYMPKLHRFLVESEGELLVVIVETGGRSIDVFRLDFESMSWIEVESLGDRVLFLGVNCSFSVSANEIGSWRGNYIYFDRCNERTNCGIYDLENGTVFFYKPHDCYRRRLQFVWVSPTFV